MAATLTSRIASHNAALLADACRADFQAGLLETNVRTGSRYRDEGGTVPEELLAK